MENLTSGENIYQKAEIVKNEKTIDYEASRSLSYIEIISISKGLDVVSEFFDVNAAVTTLGTGICAVSLGKTLEEAVQRTMDSNPVDFVKSTLVLSAEADSDIVKMLGASNIIAAPAFTQGAIDILQRRNICYVKINTPLKDYKKFLQDDIKVTSLGTLIQSPNLSELNKDTFKIVTKQKPVVEQIEDAVFAWKIAKHASSQSIVIAKDLKTSAIAQGLHSASVEFALDYSCERSKDAILASDMPVSIHDVNAAAQGRISLIIVPEAPKDVADLADKYNITVIETGITNILL